MANPARTSMSAFSFLLIVGVLLGALASPQKRHRSLTTIVKDLNKEVADSGQYWEQKLNSATRSPDPNSSCALTSWRVDQVGTNQLRFVLSIVKGSRSVEYFTARLTDLDPTKVEVRKDSGEDDDGIMGRALKAKGLPVPTMLDGPLTDIYAVGYMGDREVVEHTSPYSNEKSKVTFLALQVTSKKAAERIAELLREAVKGAKYKAR